jgi:outer membrane lipoprotein SlyB
LVATRSVSADPEFRKRQSVFAIFGAFMGALLGATIGLWIEISPVAAAIGAAVGAIAFAYCSTRWGDSAWDILSRILRWDRE